MGRKYRNFTLLTLVVGMFAMADKCAACNFAAPEYELLSLVATYTNSLKTRSVFISGPGEVPVAVPLQAPGNSRTRNLGEVFEGQRLTWELYSDGLALLDTVKCDVRSEIDFKNAHVTAFPGGGEDHPLIVCGGKQLELVDSDGFSNTLKKRQNLLRFGPTPPIK